ncbi:MAG: SPOR domain-containing protein, partial [Gammaproteobacteria bacterium]|nr:SPOR domain-containing protein [Gammaproteobacteria bacterium]
MRHEPQTRGDRLRIYLDPTGICNGVSPLIAESRSRLRPFNADSAKLVELEYEGDTLTGAVLTLVFSEPVDFDVNMPAISFDVAVRVSLPTGDTPDAAAPPTVLHRQVESPAIETSPWAINLVSLRRIPTIADAPSLQLDSEQRLYYTAVNVDGTTWYRLRLGDFDSDTDATNALAGLRTDFPGAWIDQVKSDEKATEMLTARSMLPTSGDLNDADSSLKVDALMEDARKAMARGETSRAIQIYTKVLQLPEHPRLAEAQEYLALAREKNGQTAHAKAEYQRYLSLYPNTDGAVRVRQRLAALLATRPPEDQIAGTSPSTGQSNRRAAASDWRLQTFFSQYYRRDVNQPNDQDDIVSQSALYSDVNFDARRRGKRYDFGARVS